jgi:glutamate 5-kinase
MLNEQIIKQLAFQIAEIKKNGYDTVIVSSGAMAAGRSFAPFYCNRDKIIHRQLLAAIGQVKLIHTWSLAFEEYGSICAQVLATKEDFRSRRHYLNMQNCFEAMLQDKVIPIVNENDVVSVSELMFTDNDELAGMIASMLDAEILILLTNVDGLFDGDPKNLTSKVINEIDPQKITVDKYIQKTKSEFGLGGMLTKSRIAKTLSSLGTTTFMANGKKENIIIDILDNKKIGTKFIPQKKVSKIKKWVALAKGYEKGTIFVNERAEKILKEKVSSVLPVGIIKVEGNFEKGDIIKVLNEEGKFIGLGKAEYDSDKAKELIGKTHEKPVIHYDYLFIY